ISLVRETVHRLGQRDRGQGGMRDAVADRPELQATCKSQDQARATPGDGRLDRFPASEIEADAEFHLVSLKICQIQRSGELNRSSPNLKVEGGGKPVVVGKPGKDGRAEIDSLP